MVNNNNLVPKENIVKTEEVREINNKVPSFEEFMESYESEKGVVESYENEFKSYDDISITKGYGPCSGYSCSYPDNVRFYLKIGFSHSFVFTEKWTASGRDIFHWTTMENIEQARSVLRKFESRTEEMGHYAVEEKGGAWNPCPRVTSDSWEKQREIMLKLKNYIGSHERGNEVYDLIDFSGNGGCSGVIM